MSRYAHAIFCDDIRYEIGNKHSLIGIYNGEMIAPEFPLLLPKLCVHTLIATPIDQRFSSLSVQLLQDDVIVRSNELSFEELDQMQTTMISLPDRLGPGRLMVMGSQFFLTPFHTEAPTLLTVKYIADEVEFIAGRLGINSPS
ncbi:MAG TPA: hypothetical protein VK974_07140 [Methylophilaceae bacterium]|nr:hypothetical protein [Methylophilaceae bacterium]